MCIRDRCRGGLTIRNKITYFRGSVKSSSVFQVYCCLKQMDEYYLIHFLEACNFLFFYYVCTGALAHASLANNPLYHLRISYLVGTNKSEKRIKESD